MCHVDEYDKVAKVLYRTPVQFSEILKKITPALIFFFQYFVLLLLRVVIIIVLYEQGFKKLKNIVVFFNQMRLTNELISAFIIFKGNKKLFVLSRFWLLLDIFSDNMKINVLHICYL